MPGKSVPPYGPRARLSRRRIFLGRGTGQGRKSFRRRRLRGGQRALNETAAPLGLRQDGVSVGECEFSGDLGVASLLPLQGDRLALLLAATSDEALDTTVELLATPTIPPMARQPFSNALPDVVVLDARQARRFGPGGFRLAGFRDHDWSFAHQASYAEECRPWCDARRRRRRRRPGRTDDDTQTRHS